MIQKIIIQSKIVKIMKIKKLKGLIAFLSFLVRNLKDPAIVFLARTKVLLKTK